MQHARRRSQLIPDAWIGLLMVLVALVGGFFIGVLGSAVWHALFRVVHLH